LAAPTEDKATFFVMPDFVGRPFGEATAAMAEGGFAVGDVTVAFRPGSPLATPDRPVKLKPIATDTIVSQSPAAGQRIAAGTQIGFDVIR
jgi:beta-lactam-binding protein with PASTA domain